MTAFFTVIVIFLFVNLITLFCMAFYLKRIRDEIIILNDTSVKTLNVLKEISVSEKEKKSTLEPKNK